MLFNSIEFVWLVVVTCFLFYLPILRRFQLLVLTLSSFVFYAYGQPYLLLLLISSALINAVSSYEVLRAKTVVRQRIAAVTGVSANLMILGFFKYAGLFGDLCGLSQQGAGHFLLMIPLPVGISFYTFQGISLVVDVFRIGRGCGEAQQIPVDSFRRHVGRTLFFISFFPQLVAGPIVKAHDFYPQIRTKYLHDVAFLKVFRLLVLGYFLKMVVADNLKDYTFWIQYPYFLGKSSVELVLFLIGFSAQIFADFAGYSLIAIGVGALFGYRLPENFNCPYLSRSVTEFWRRWHMSLSAWLKEYLYIPLGGGRRGTARTYANLFIVMFLGGLWHGAAVSYAVWGTWHGIALALERPHVKRGRFVKVSGPFSILDSLRIVLVFAFVTCSWLLFKLPDFSQALAYLSSMRANLAIKPNFGGCLMILLFSSPVALHHLAGIGKRTLPVIMDCMLYGVMLALLILNSGSAGAFIYFQF